MAHYTFADERSDEEGQEKFQEVNRTQTEISITEKLVCRTNIFNRPISKQPTKPAQAQQYAVLHVTVSNYPEKHKP
jgi:hypothetical protein